MHKALKKLAAVMFAAVMTLSVYTPAVSADEPYDVYNYDRWGEAIPSQAGYVAERAVSGEDLGIGHFSAPSDIFKDSYDNFYIADSGNNRIVVINSGFTSVIKILEEFDYNGEKLTLKNPKGVYVSPFDDYIYIADNENSRVIKCDINGNVELIVTKPDSKLYTQETFLPSKVLVDKAGYIYIVVNNITSGAVMFNSDGEFLGFYGANRVTPTAEVIANYAWNLIATDEMRARRSRTVPAGFTNFDIDNEDFIFTCTESSSQDTDVIKKLNAAGENLFDSLDVNFGDVDVVYNNSTYKTMLTDIDISDDGYINCLDFTSGRIFQYDKEGSLMFIIGGKADQTGGFKQVSAIESMEKNLYVTDTLKNNVTIFSQTVFGEVVHEATDLYNEGYYDEALQPWYEVLKRDGNYRRAYVGIANAMLTKGDYDTALKYAELSGSSKLYDKAFEGVRQEWLDEHFSLICAVIIILVIVIFGYKFAVKKQIINPISLDNFRKNKEGDLK